MGFLLFLSSCSEGLLLVLIVLQVHHHVLRAGFSFFLILFRTIVLPESEDFIISGNSPALLFPDIASPCPLCRFWDSYSSDFSSTLQYFHFCASLPPPPSHSVVSDSLRPHALQPARPLCPWDFPGKNPGVGCHFLLQGIFPAQGSNPVSRIAGQTFYRLSHQGSPKFSVSTAKYQ